MWKLFIGCKDTLFYPVHLAQDGYVCLAAKVTAMLAGTDTEDKPADPAVFWGAQARQEPVSGGRTAS
jgi:hypothetical protein